MFLILFFSQCWRIPCESIRWLCGSWGKENILFCLLLDCSPLTIANTANNQLAGLGLRKTITHWFISMDTNVCPWISHSWGTVRQPNHCPFPWASQSYKGSVPFGLCSDWGSIRKKGSWASKLETSGALGFYHLCCSTESHLAPESGDWCTRLTIKTQGLVRIVVWNHNNNSKV